MSESTFEKIQRSEQYLYGPRKLLLCGFAAEAQPEFKALLEMLGITDLPVVWLSQAHAGAMIQDLAGLPDGTGADNSSTLPRAVLVGGITQNELHRIMTGCREAGMKQALWAALTPTSVGWPLQRLLGELVAERKALAARKSNRQ